jgi:transposase
MVRRKAIKLINKGWSYTKTARYLGCNRSTILRWHKRFESRHYFGLYNKSKRPRTIDKKTTCFEHQELIIKLRRETRYCHQRLAILLNRDYHLSIKPITIYRILKRNNLIEHKKKYQRPFNQSKRPYPITACSLIQTDTKHILIDNNKYYQYTFLDVSTRYQVAFIFKRLSPIIAGKMLEKSISQFPF